MGGAIATLFLNEFTERDTSMALCPHFHQKSR